MYVSIKLDILVYYITLYKERGDNIVTFCNKIKTDNFKTITKYLILLGTKFNVKNPFHPSKPLPENVLINVYGGYLT